MALIVSRGDDDPDLLARVQSLRIAAWEPILGRAQAEARFGLDDHDDRSLHCVIPGPTSDELVAAGRVTVCNQLRDLPEPVSFEPHSGEMALPLAVAGRLIVHPDHRGRGLAEQVIVARLDLARDLELREVWSETRQAQMHGFLRHGYQSIGPSADRSVPGDWQILRAKL